MFTSDERERYEAQFELPGFGMEGQMKLKQSKVLVIGAGGLGCPVLQYLAAAGIGMLGLADGGKVTMQSLQRQVLYGASDLGQNKAEVATRRLKLINDNNLYNCYPFNFSNDVAPTIIRIYDLIIDCTNSVEIATVIDEPCRKFQKTLVQGNICDYVGQVGVFDYPGSTGRLLSKGGSLFVDSKPTGSFGFNSGVIGSIMAGEAVKILAGLGSNLKGKVMKIDFLQNKFVIEENR